MHGRLPDEALTYLNMKSFCVTLVSGIVLGALVFMFLPREWRIVAFTALAALIVISVVVELPWLNRMQVKYTHFTVDDQFVHIHRGKYFSRDISIPRRQVLSVGIHQNPLMSRHGLVSLKFNLIFGAESLGPLHRDQALAVRRRLLRLDDHASQT